MSRAVITGIGWVGAHGAGRETLAAALAAGRPQVVPVELSRVPRRTGDARLAALVAAETLAPLVPAAAARRMSVPSRMAIAATRLALADAGLDENDPGFAGTGIVMATVFGPVRITEQMLDAILRHAPDQASPFQFTESVASAPASQVALRVRALGPNLTITEREAGPLVALAEGVRLIERRGVERVLVGCVEEMSPLLHALLGRFQVLARPDGEGREIPRPFDCSRSGLLAADGAAMLVLESTEAAAARGARPLAAVEAAWCGFDPAAPPLGWGRDPATLAAVLTRGLARRGLSPSSFDRVLSGASGTRAGDRLEGLVLRRVFGDDLPAVLAPKGTTGEYGGGFLAAAALALGGPASWPTPGFAEIDPELELCPHDGSPLAEPHRILASSLGAGGAAAWAVFARP